MTSSAAVSSGSSAVSSRAATSSRREVALRHLVEGDQGGPADAGVVGGQALGRGARGRRFRSGHRSARVPARGRRRGEGRPAAPARRQPRRSGRGRWRHCEALEAAVSAAVQQLGTNRRYCRRIARCAGAIGCGCEHCRVLVGQAEQPHAALGLGRADAGERPDCILAYGGVFVDDSPVEHQGRPRCLGGPTDSSSARGRRAGHRQAAE